MPTSSGCATQLGDDAEQPRYIATVRGAGYRALTGTRP